MGACRFIYNLGLETKIRAWNSIQKNVTSYELMRQLTDLKTVEGFEWLRECSSQSLESSLTNLDRAYQGFFKGKGFPKFKKKSGHQSITFRRDSKIEGSRIRVSKIGFIDFIKHRPLPEAEIRTCTVSKSPTGEFYVSILINDGKALPQKKPIVANTTVGIDLGLKTFATLSNGQSFENPRHFENQQRRLRVEQRKLSRRYRRGISYENQSNRWKRQKLIVAQLNEKIANQRKDFLQKTSTEIINRFDTICLENLNVSGLMRNRKMAKSIGSASWYGFTRMLEYKAEWTGKNIQYIGTFEPSSKVCSNCGHIFKELKLSQRDWNCNNCGIHHDRDQNAASNIKNFGLRTQPITGNVSH